MNTATQQRPARGGEIESGLSVRESQTRELSTSAMAAEKEAEVKAAIISARQFPRSEDDAFVRLMRSCERSSFAADVCYEYPRGGTDIKGPSVKLAREAARIWGNIRYGQSIVADDDDSRTIRGEAWDCETNTRVTAEDTFAKKIWRKNKRGGGGEWVTPDERDLRELTNRRGAILVRNCILQLLPPDLIEDAVRRADSTNASEVAKDPERHRKQVTESFASIGVPVRELEQFLGLPIGQASPAQLQRLRDVYKSIRDGNSSWVDYKPKGDPQPPASNGGGVTGEGLANGKQAGASEPAASNAPAEPERSQKYRSLVDMLNAASEPTFVEYVLDDALPKAVDGGLIEAEAAEIKRLGQEKLTELGRANQQPAEGE